MPTLLRSGGQRRGPERLGEPQRQTRAGPRTREAGPEAETHQQAWDQCGTHATLSEFRWISLRTGPINNWRLVAAYTIPAPQAPGRAVGWLHLIRARYSGPS